MALLPVSASSKTTTQKLSSLAQAAITYHDIFDYPLTEGELIKWEVARRVVRGRQFAKKIIFKNGFYFTAGRDGLILKRLVRERNSSNKLIIARKAGDTLQVVPGIKGVFITGALAMGSADESSDIDLMIVTQKGLLWTTRLLTFLLLRLVGISLRKPGQVEQKDKLCLNMWFDEGALSWPKKKRNLFSAHEIAQVIPIINKEQIYERFLFSNRWLKKYWPNAVRIERTANNVQRTDKNLYAKTYTLLPRLVEKFAFWIQYSYMKPKITREVVTSHKAIFHPNDLEGIVLTRFRSYFV